MLRRLLLTAATATACALGATASASAAPFSVLQVNLCGSGKAKCFGKGSPNKAGKAAELLRARRPNVATLNELCANDLETIRRATGYTGAFNASGTQTCTNGQPYGNAVVVAPGVRVAAVPLRLAYLSQQPGSEKRTLMCLDGAGVRTCVTHLDSAGKQRFQAAQMRDAMARYANAGVPTILGGDWNLSFGGRPSAQDFVPAGMVRKGDGDVQHVMATARQFTFVRTRSMRLDWTDHPGFQVTYERR